MLTMILLAFFAVNQGAAINQPDERVTLVRTDQTPDHNAVLDSAQFARLKPYTVTMRSKNGEAIRTVGISFDVVDAEGIRQSFANIYDMPKGKSVVHRGDSTSFWPGGRISTTISGNPIMTTLPSDRMAVIETAKSVTVTVTYLEFEDGTILDFGGGRFVTFYRKGRK